MKKQGSGWKGESRRHSLARKGVKTVLPDGRRFDVSKFVANGLDFDVFWYLEELVMDNEIPDMDWFYSGYPLETQKLIEIALEMDANDWTLIDLINEYGDQLTDFEIKQIEIWAEDLPNVWISKEYALDYLERWHDEIKNKIISQENVSDDYAEQLINELKIELKPNKHNIVSVIHNANTRDLKVLRHTDPLSYQFYRLIKSMDKDGIYVDYVNQDNNRIYFRLKDNRNKKTSYIMDLSFEELMEYDTYDNEKLKKEIY